MSRPPIVKAGSTREFNLSDVRQYRSDIEVNEKSLLLNNRLSQLLYKFE